MFRPKHIDQVKMIRTMSKHHDSLTPKKTASNSDLITSTLSSQIYLPESDKLAALYILKDIPGFGYSKFKLLCEKGIHPKDVLQHAKQLRLQKETRNAIDQVCSDSHIFAAAQKRAEEDINMAKTISASILTIGDAHYPNSVYHSKYSTPILFVKGDPTIWNTSESIAVVGSREIREPYASSVKKFASAAVNRGVTIVSGFASGADTIAHLAALELGGRTICVMPCGVDKYFPPENRSLWREFICYSGATFVSEYSFGKITYASRLKERNKLIVAFSQGLLMAQARAKAGSMISYNYCRKQDPQKPIATFEQDGVCGTEGNAIVESESTSLDMVFKPEANEEDFQKWLQKVF